MSNILCLEYLSNIQFRLIKAFKENVFFFFIKIFHHQKQKKKKKAGQKNQNKEKLEIELKKGGKNRAE